ncbi:hypothetical protein ACGFX4_10265 [Kitasatospora sp. NPDC048365]|uniref:hypothetical protein n=1 Tax=Kitasatospora sp. NPDC048365 TaxID=3364050 RepID=UPI003716587B
MAYDLAPHVLGWADVDPARHPFDAAAAPVAVAGLGPARSVPVRPVGGAADRAVIAWSYAEGREWTEAMTRALVERYGPWSLGWRWARDEGDIGGGPVGAWCCPRDSITTPDDTLARVAAALCEWRSWVVELAERFERHPLDSGSAGQRSLAWERATVQLVNLVVDRTGAGDAWYGHCRQVLGWFLTRWGVAPDAADLMVAEAIDGRFHSWAEPSRELVAEVAEQLAARADGGPAW